jgi:short subunit dehydrogenase-like uncharacterized protein
MSLLIYGANGYTGELIARRAAKKGIAAILAGRRAEAVAALADELSRPARVFSLDEGVPAEQLAGVTAVLNCAGPFSRTARSLLEACLAARVHYLDISGEVAVLEMVAGNDARARAAGITLLPGAGFDVVPSDCLAAEIKHRLPTANELALAFQPSGQMSRGTAITTIESAALGGLIRRNGALVKVASGYRTRSIDFGEGPRKAITIPWGDVSTAYFTTGIPNIEVYVAVPRALRIGVRLARHLGPILESRALQRLLVARAQKGAPGPTADERARDETRLWAEGRDPNGASIELRMRAPEGYELTSWTALELAERASRGELPPGFQTPAAAAGRGFILEFPGVSLEVVE